MRRPDARRPTALPYGAVMATGGVSRLCDAVGWSAPAAPMLWLATAAALAIPLYGGLARRAAGEPIRWIPSCPPGRLFGQFTVPLGLAVVGSGLAQVSVVPATLAAVSAWLTTGALVVTVVIGVLRTPPGLLAVDGTWFLAPAALAGDAVATAAVVPLAPGAARVPLGCAALVACGLGVLGYAVVLALAGWRVACWRMSGCALCPWWISAGCGGLVAASVGSVESATPATGLATLYAGTALTCWIVAGVLLVRVLLTCARYVWTMRSVSQAAPWIPAFSTVVYAMGALEVGRLCHAPAIGTVGRAAALAAIVMWVVTVMLRVLPARWRNAAA